MLQQKPDIRSSFVFRMGELHVVFCALKVIGKLINCSGLDQIFDEAGIYGLTTIGQIKEGKHMYRALEAHFSLYIALDKMYLNRFINEHPQIGKELRQHVVDAVENISKFDDDNKEEVQQNHKRIIDEITKINFIGLKDAFDKSLKNQAKFYRLYMNLFELILSFIRAKREESWNLHLSSLHDLCPYFFSFDMINYARMTPVYLSQMTSLKKNDERTWRLMLTGGFCVGKSRYKGSWRYKRYWEFKFELGRIFHINSRNK